MIDKSEVRYGSRNREPDNQRGGHRCRRLPKGLYKASQNRTVRKDACLWIAFYFETEDVLTADARVKAMRNALTHNHSWTELRHCKFEESRTVQVLLSSIVEPWKSVSRP